MPHMRRLPWTCSGAPLLSCCVHPPRHETPGGDSARCVLSDYTRTPTVLQYNDIIFRSHLRTQLVPQDVPNHWLSNTLCLYWQTTTVHVFHGFENTTRSVPNPVACIGPCHPRNALLTCCTRPRVMATTSNRMAPVTACIRQYCRAIAINRRCLARVTQNSGCP